MPEPYISTVCFICKSYMDRDMSKILGDSLSEEVFWLLRSKVPTVVLATVSGDGRPNTTPIHLIYAKDRKRILMAIARRHQGRANIKKTGKVMLCLCEEGNINVSISGTASVIKEHLDSSREMSLVLLDVEEVKDDSTHSETISGIRYHCVSKRGDEFIKRVFAELEKYPL